MYIYIYIYVLIYFSPELLLAEPLLLAVLRGTPRLI